jgi:RNA polymerase sigma factor (sigma-70 family)
MTDRGYEDVWREEAPHVLAALLRRSGDLGACEDAVQEALLAAARQWPSDGPPDDPRGWLVRVASRRLLDHERSEIARARREERVAAARPRGDFAAVPADVAVERPEQDDTLLLLLLCCHPAVSPPAQVALTLRAVAGLSTAQIAAAFLVPEATMAQRISRAKTALRRAGARFDRLPENALGQRLAAVRSVLYLLFNEGYAASAGRQLIDPDLTREAVRLAGELLRARPDDSETAGLLALMLLTDARSPGRRDDTGDLVPLAEQDRSRWDHEKIRRGTALLEDALARPPVGPFQLQAAVAAVHAQARTWQDTDWLQICALYRMLDRLAPAPAVTLNLAIAVGMAHGPTAGLGTLAPLLATPGQRHNHRLHAAHAHLLELAGDDTGAAEAYRRALRLSRSLPEQRYLGRRLARLGSGPSSVPGMGDGPDQVSNGPDEDAIPTEAPATWENVVVGKAKEALGHAVRDDDLAEEGADQVEVAHEVHDERRS